MKNMRWARLVSAALIILVAGGAMTVGCSDFVSPEEDDNDDGYPLRTSHANTVEKLRQAYAAMDTTAFEDCLGSTFEFWLNPGDLNDPQNPLPQYWGQTEEMGIATNMFGPATDVLSMSLTLTKLGDAVEVPGANPEDPSTWLCTYDVDLFVFLPNDLTLWANAAALFTVSVDPDGTGPAGETLWEITKWEDIDDPARSEECTWGSIKAMYR